MALTGRLALAAVAGALVCGVLPGAVTFLAVLAVLLLGVLADLVLAAPVSALRFRRSGDTAVRLGGTATVELVVANPGDRTLRAMVRDAWPPSAGAATTRHRITVPGGERRRLSTALTPTRRGDRRADRVTVRSLGPLGLAARQGGHTVAWTVRALPPFTSRRHLPSRLARLRELDGRTSVMIRGQGTEFDSLREYVIGDDVRSIDWRASARAADVVVRTWRPERDRQVLIVLDTGRTAAGRVGDGPRLDTAMDAALLLGALAAHAGDTVGLMAYDRTVRAQVGGTGRGDLLPALVAAMAPLEPELIETDVRGMVAAVLGRTTRRCLVVLFTGLDPATVTEGLLPGLPALITRHTVVVASVADPRIGELAADRTDADAVYGAAAAERARTERHTATAQLTRRGVTVVDEPPDKLAPAVADAYLALKAAG
ncbi:MAG: DUF58 domain-containing protein, partial [Pseudonocardia sp.]|nr:DUF58 domain-containing protein [Pseudonocardia sp.]